MDWAKQAEEMFKTWTETQQKMWGGWVEAMREAAKPPATRAWERSLDTWSESVKSLLKVQADWVRSWADNMAKMPGVSEETAQWAGHIHEMTERWTEAQEQLWTQWFETIKKLEPSKIVSGSGAWSKEGQQVVQHWQETMQRVLDAQIEWARQWASGQGKESDE